MKAPAEKKAKKNFLLSTMAMSGRGCSPRNTVTDTGTKWRREKKPTERCRGPQNVYAIKIYELRNIGRLEATEILLSSYVGVCLYITAVGGGTGGKSGRRAEGEGKEGQEEREMRPRGKQGRGKGGGVRSKAEER